LVLATLHANSFQSGDRPHPQFLSGRAARAVAHGLSLTSRSGFHQRFESCATGSGRIAAMEIMLTSPLISDLIFKGDVAKIKDVMGAAPTAWA